MLYVLVWQENKPGALYPVPKNNHKSAVNLAIELLTKSNFEFNLEEAIDYLETDGNYTIPLRNFSVYILVSNH